MASSADLRARATVLLLAVLLAGAAIAGLLLFGPGRSDPGATPDAPPPAVRAAAAPRVAEPASRTDTVEPTTPAPPGPAQPVVDLTDDEVRALERPAVAPGEVAGLVLRGRRPVAGARVRLFALPRTPSDAAGLEERTLFEARTDAQGLFAFQDVPEGSRHGLRADDGPEHVELPYLDVSRARFGKRLVLRFGSAKVTGQVFDDAGAVRPGLPVRTILLGDQDVGGGGTQEALTDAEGRFELAGLLPGRRHVTLLPPGDWDAANQRLIRLGTGGTARLVFGQPYPFGELTARLQDGLGDPIPGVRHLFLADVDTLDERRLTTEEDGTFACELPAGTWEVHEANGLFRGIAMGAFVMPRTDARVDVTLDTTRLRVRVDSYPGSDPHEAAKAAARSLVLAPADSSELRAAEVHGDELQWLGVTPGRYEIRATAPFCKLVPDAPHPVDVAPGQLVVRLELLVDA